MIITIATSVADAVAEGRAFVPSLGRCVSVCVHANALKCNRYLCMTHAIVDAAVVIMRVRIVWLCMCRMASYWNWREQYAH